MLICGPNATRSPNAFPSLIPHAHAMLCPDLQPVVHTGLFAHLPADAHQSCSLEALNEQSSSRDASFMDVQDEGPFGLAPDDFMGVLFDVIPGRLSFTIHRDEDHTKKCIKEHPKLFFFSSWMQEAYDSFCSDFGPVNISLVARFCEFIKEKLADPRIARRHLVYYCEPDKNFVMNCVFLLSSYLVLHENCSPEQAASCFEAFLAPEFPGFRDASNLPSSFDLTVLDCLRGLRRAVEAGIFDIKSFDIAAYEALEDPRIADLHIVCSKFVAFRGPTDLQQDQYSHPPAHYLPLFSRLGVGSVVRLNEKDSYDQKAFENNGVAHHDLEFADGSAPSLEDCRRFLHICDGEPHKVAVHCKAGLGRTGTMIALWMMREFGWTAREVIAWLRLVRPGSIIGPQQHFLQRCEALLREASPFPPKPAQSSESSCTNAPKRCEDTEMMEESMECGGDEKHPWEGDVLVCCGVLDVQA